MKREGGQAYLTCEGCDGIPNPDTQDQWVEKDPETGKMMMRGVEGGSWIKTCPVCVLKGSSWFGDVCSAFMWMKENQQVHNLIHNPTDVLTSGVLAISQEQTALTVERYQRDSNK